MPIYPLLPGVIFREDFTSAKSIADNGGLITGAGYKSQTQSYYPTSTNNIVYRPIAPQLFRLNVLTICVSANLPGQTGTYATLLHVNNSSVGPTYQVGLNLNTNQLFWYQGVTVSLSPSNYTVAKRQSLFFVCDGTNTTFYQNTTSLGSVVAATSATIADTNNTCIIGNHSITGSQPYNSQIYHVSVFDYAFTQSDVTSYHNMLTRLK